MRFLHLFFILISYSLFGQNQLNTEFVSQLSFSNQLNDIWGYQAPNGIEYALVGTRRETIIVSLETPENPKVVATIPGTRSIWRDIKTHEKYAYVVADQGTDGLLIIDMSNLPDSVSFKFWKPQIDINGNPTPLTTCHNLYVDNGYIYLSGCRIGNQGIIILDVNQDPMNPVVVGAADLNYSHDAFVRDTLLFTSEINRGQLGIYSIADKTKPTLLATQLTTSTFTHNAWSSDDNKYVFTTDERANAFVDAYDISDLDQIQKIDKYQVLATKGSGVIPHNAHYHNGFLVTSWYTEGVVIMDVHRPDNLIRVGQYDTWDGGNGGFNGCWGAYPFLPSGLVLASDIENGLFVFKPNYKRASYLEGMVLGAKDNRAINGAEVTILSNEKNEANSDVMGVYKTGQAEDGTFLAIASHPQYLTDTVEINLISGEVTEVDFELVELEPVQLSALIVDKESGESLNEVFFSIISSSDNQALKTDEAGEVDISTFSGPLTVYAGKLGYKTVELKLDLEGKAIVFIELQKGIEDDFVFDYGWTVRSTASTGEWIRNIPQGTLFDGNKKSNPDTDAPNDIGNLAYVTGVNTTNASIHDVDDGMTTLSSPLFDISSLDNPEIEYALWFFNGGGAGTAPNDYLEVFIANSLDTVLVESVRNNSGQSGFWREKSKINIEEHLGKSSLVRVIVITEDANPGHLVEAGFDDFAIVASKSTPTQEEIADADIIISPNAFTNFLQIKVSKNLKSVTLYDLTGKLVLTEKYAKSSLIQLNTRGLSPSPYLIEIITEDGVRITEKVIKI